MVYFCVGKMYGFTYRPETREKAIINDCEQSNCVCVSETCDSSHTGGVQGPAMIYGLIEWRRVGKWRKCRQKLRASEASEPIFLYISALKTYNSSQISIYALLINHCLSVQYVHDCVRNTRDMVLFIILTRTQETWEKLYRASQNWCTFASEKCFTYRPETREKAIINDCEQSNCVCVSETCDSSHTGGVQGPAMIYGLIEWRRVGKWRKCRQNCERAKRASRFFYIYLRWKHTILLKSQYMHCW